VIDGLVVSASAPHVFLVLLETWKAQSGQGHFSQGCAGLF
jgi:hypothetical protein